MRALALLLSVLTLSVFVAAYSQADPTSVDNLDVKAATFDDLFSSLRDIEKSLPADGDTADERARLMALDDQLVEIGLSLAADAIEQQNDTLARRVLARMLTRSADVRVLAMIQVSFGRPLQGEEDPAPTRIVRTPTPTQSKQPAADRHLQRTLRLLEDRLRQIERSLNNDNFAESRIERLEDQVRSNDNELQRLTRRLERLDQRVQRLR